MDPNISTAELYRSYVSRASDYSVGQIDFLLVACQIVYPYIDASMLNDMIHTVIALRRRDVFYAYDQNTPPARERVDAPTDCAVAVAQALLPGRTPAFYRRFRELDAPTLHALFTAHAVPALIVRDDEPFPNVSNTALINSRHCIAYVSGRRRA